MYSSALLTLLIYHYFDSVLCAYRQEKLKKRAKKANKVTLSFGDDEEEIQTEETDGN